MSLDASALIGDLRYQLQENPEQYNREKLRETARKLSVALETPADTLRRITFLPMITTVCRIAIQLNLFNVLVECHGPRSSEELAQKTTADRDLLFRLLRYLAASEIIEESGEDLWIASSITKALTIPGLAAGLNFSNDTYGPALLALPAFLKEINYQDPMISKRSAFQFAHGTTDTMFEWLVKHPEEHHDFDLTMRARREGQANWLDFFPLEERIVHGFQTKDDAVLIVDIGGGLGQVIESILDKYPDLKGRCILQDLPETIKRIESPRTGLEPMAHDFFLPQPIKGARAYHLKSILHDWPDHQCKIILERTVAAMEKGYSKIIINETVLPNKGVNLNCAHRDLRMMILLGAMERTEKQWRKLLGSVGLTIEKIWTAKQDDESIIEAVLL
ncbi:hypothetical protein MMC22_004355 [Lobaria immixta]|nr:hypothetical protein [Lobaria immixta]